MECATAHNILTFRITRHPLFLVAIFYLVKNHNLGMFIIKSHYEHETTNSVKGKELHQQIVLSNPPYQLKQYLST